MNPWSLPSYGKSSVHIPSTQIMFLASLLLVSSGDEISVTVALVLDSTFKISLHVRVI